MNSRGHGNLACPYLGLEEDADTSLAFPSIWNTCHRTQRVVAPSLEHQAGYCLTENHRNCVAFPAEKATLPLPHRLRAPQRRTNLPVRNLIFLFIGILVLAGLGWGFLNRGAIPFIGTGTPSPAQTVTAIPAASQTATLTPVPVFTITTAPEPVPVGDILSKRQLDQPIGSDYKFVIHKVREGENLNQYAIKYNTSVDAILAVNYDLKTPVWVDELVIIPVGFTNVYGLPAFEAYEVPRTNVTLDVLALSFGVSLKDLRYYNAIDMNEALQIGDWLLIPHLKKKS